MLALRKLKNLSRERLAKLSNVSVRTIQRLENAGQGSLSPHGNTVERLAKALDVEPGVLTGALPMPESGETPRADVPRVQIGAELAPKARLAYDLVKRRYGVSATEIINMAPLFFTLLAEGSLVWRREKLGDANEAIYRLEQLESELGYTLFGGVTDLASITDDAEHASVDNADLFGDQLQSDVMQSRGLSPFNPYTGNPFARYLRKLAGDLDKSEVVAVPPKELSYGSPSRFPDYDLCGAELEQVANGSANARRALETGFVRLGDVPEELSGEDAAAPRAAWLEETLPEIYRDLEDGQPIAGIAEFVATSTPSEKKVVLDFQQALVDLAFDDAAEPGDDR